MYIGGIFFWKWVNCPVQYEVEGIAMALGMQVSSDRPSVQTLARWSFGKRREAFRSRRKSCDGGGFPSDRIFSSASSGLAHLFSGNCGTTCRLGERRRASVLREGLWSMSLLHSMFLVRRWP